MADITDPQVVRFANERARVFADVMEQVYQTAKRYQQEFAALTVPNTADRVVDGSEADGRKPVRGQMLTALKTAADDIVIWFEQGNPSRIARIQLISVNGGARF